MLAIATIPETHIVLFEKPIVASLATILPSGLIQVNPVWCDYDGMFARFNSAEGRQKDKNIRRNNVATVLLVDPENDYFWVEVRGHVVEITREGADAHIDSLAKKYLGVDKYPFRRSGEVRVMYKLLPEQVKVNSPQ